MHADSRPEPADTPRPAGTDPHADSMPMPVLPFWFTQLFRGMLRLRISGPEPAGWQGYHPASFLAIEDEICDVPVPSFTLVHDPEQALTRAAAVIHDLARTNALVASCFVARDALEARVRFLRQMEELTTSPGVSERELELLENGLLTMAEGMPHPMGRPRPESASPYTHTFGSRPPDVRTAQIAPRKNGKSEALRKARTEHVDSGDPS